MDYLRERALSWLMMTENGAGAFDERDGDSEDPTPRDVPMTAARHTALAILSTLNDRYNIGEIVGYNNDERAELVDELTHIAEAVVGPGPFNVNVALELNKTHRMAELYHLDYGVGMENGMMVVHLAGEDHAVETAIPADEVTEDTLFSALKSNLAELPVKSPK